MSSGEQPTEEQKKAVAAANLRTATAPALPNSRKYNVESIGELQEVKVNRGPMVPVNGYAAAGGRRRTKGRKNRKTRSTRRRR